MITNSSVTTLSMPAKSAKSASLNSQPDTRFTSVMEKVNSVTNDKASSTNEEPISSGASNEQASISPKNASHNLSAEKEAQATTSSDEGALTAPPLEESGEEVIAESDEQDGKDYPNEWQELAAESESSSAEESVSNEEQDALVVDDVLLNENQGLADSNQTITKQSANNEVEPGMENSLLKGVKTEEVGQDKSVLGASSDASSVADGVTEQVIMAQDEVITSNVVQSSEAVSNFPSQDASTDEIILTAQPEKEGALELSSGDGQEETEELVANVAVTPSSQSGQASVDKELLIEKSADSVQFAKATIADGQEGGKSKVDNLRWVLEQMSVSSQKTANNTVDQKSVSSDFTLEEGMSLQLDGELVEIKSQDQLFSKNGEELVANKKAVEQLFTNLGASNQSIATSTVVSGQALNGAVRNDSMPAQLTMQSLPNSQLFPNEMATKVSWVAKEGFKTAHIQLDPPELGSLTVKVSVDQDSNTHISFVASSAQAKDSLEGQMQRLRDMLQQQGLELDSVDVEVSQGNDQSLGSNNSHTQEGGGDSLGNISEADGVDDELENLAYVTPAEQGIDYYA